MKEQLEIDLADSKPVNRSEAYWGIGGVAFLFTVGAISHYITDYKLFPYIQNCAGEEIIFVGKEQYVLKEIDGEQTLKMYEGSSIDNACE